MRVLANMVVNGARCDIVFFFRQMFELEVQPCVLNSRFEYLSPKLAFSSNIHKFIY